MIEIKYTDEENEYYLSMEDLFESDFELIMDTDAVFYKNDKLYKKALENDYYGRYTFTFEYTDGTKSKYDFVYFDHEKDCYGIEEMEFLPVRLDDTRIFKHIVDCYFEFDDDTVKRVTVDYVSYKDYLKNVGKDELVTCTGQIRKIHPEDIYEYSEEYDVNFQVAEEDFEDSYSTSMSLFDFDELMQENMKNDNYMGKIKQYYVTSIGMPLYVYYDIYENDLLEINVRTEDIRNPDPLIFYDLLTDDNCRLVQCICRRVEYVPYEQVGEWCIKTEDNLEIL